MNYAHIHLLLNHLPILGTIFGLLLLAWATLRKSDELRCVSLGVFVVTAALAIPAYLTGEPAEEVVEHLPGVAESIIEQHENAALFALLGAALTGLVALVGLVFARRAAHLSGAVLAAVAVLAVGTSGLMGWTGNLGGQIRHTEIRSGASMTSEEQPQNSQSPSQQEGHEHHED